MEEYDYYHVRINNKTENPTSDFNLMMNDMEITNEGKWDKDHEGKMKVGDFLGFITGEKGKERVHIFKVKEELPLNKRESWWSNMKYTENNGVGITKHRVPILLTREHELPKTWEWSDIKLKVGLSTDLSSWMPRGTQRVVKKQLLPFINDNNVFSSKNGLDLIKTLYD
jgi:hypothetical protein